MGLPIERTEKNEIVSVPTLMNYITADTKAPFVRRDTSGTDEPPQAIAWDTAKVNVQNGRLHDISFDRNGFELVPSDLPEDIDFYDQQNVVKNYYPLCQEILKKRLGEGVQVYAFDHNVRSNAERRDMENSNGAKVQDPLAIVHADYTLSSAPTRLQQLTKPPKTNDIHRQFLKEGETLLDPLEIEQALKGKRRFAMANVWRNINRQSPVLQRPLACVDAQSVTTDCLRTFSIHYVDRVGENYFIVNEPQQHKWLYFPEMTHNEAILLKQWDSAGNVAKGESRDADLSTFSIHSAFADPSSPEDAPPRESIEVRCVIIYPEDESSD